MLTFGSLFAGIGGFDLGFEQAGMTCLWQVEIDNQCNEVLVHHWSNVERLEDIQNVGRHNLRSVDLICGGFPCQDLSVAGKREGLSGERSGLWFEFHRVLEELRPRWAIIENVPGLLSSNGGRDFAVVLRGLAELRYGITWRVLDAQYFGVAQRRRRAFLVGSLGDGRSAEVLFESEGSAWDSPPSRETGQGIADNSISRALTGCKTATGRLDPNGQTFIASTLDSGEWRGPNRNQIGNMVIDNDCFTPWDHESKRIHNPNGPAPTIAGSDGRGGQRMPYVAYGFSQESDGNTVRNAEDVARSITGRHGDPGVVAYGESGQGFWQEGIRPLRAEGENRPSRPSNIIAFRTNQTGAQGPIYSNGLTDTLAQNHPPSIVSPTIGADIARQAGGHPGIEEYTNAVMQCGFGVRRLTPTECERLQGFPDGWTLVNGMSDSARYRMLGNAVAVPCARWIGQRIMEIENAK